MELKTYREIKRPAAENHDRDIYFIQIKFCYPNHPDDLKSLSF